MTVPGPDDATLDSTEPRDPARAGDGPRAILRVPEVLSAIAARPAGASLAELSLQLGLPKSSLHRLLRTLEHGGYLLHRAGHYTPGPEAFRLARTIGAASPSADFPACARPVLEWLAGQSGETVMLSVLSDARTESVYVEVIESEAPLRFSLRRGNRRPLFSTASGKAMLAFCPPDEQRRYLEQADFLQFTQETTGRRAMPPLLDEARTRAVVFDRNGIVDGASGVASPCLDREGVLFCAVSVAGPTERIEAHRARLEALVLEAGERISRILGYGDRYPPA
jgi:DNA-binding IclR family transcriptional regulator